MALAVASRAVGGRFDALGLDDLQAEFDGVALGRPVQLGDEFDRADILGGVAVAIEAPCHRKGLNLFHFDHLVDPAMAGDAGDAAGDVGLVVEVDVIGEAVDFHPGDGLAGGVALTNHLQLGALFPDPVVAVHTGLGGGDSGEARFFDRGMAVVAIHTEISGVELVAVGDGLLGGVPGIDLFRMEQVSGHAASARQDQDDTGKRKPQRRVKLL